MNIKGNRKFYAYCIGVVVCGAVSLANRMTGDVALVFSVLFGGFFGGNAIEHRSAKGSIG